MKPNFRRSFLVLASSSLMVISSVSAATYYWDDNSTTAGFGAAGDIWGTNAFWTTDGTGTFGVAGIISPTTSDDLNFGNGATGLAAGTISVTGTVNARTLTFASGSGAILLSGGTINLAAASTITVNNTTNTIDSILSGAATSLTKAGSGTLTLSGNNSYTGVTAVGTSVGGGVLEVTKLANGGANSSIGASSNAASNLVLHRGSILRYTGTGDSTNRLLTLGPVTGAFSGSIESSGTGALKFTNTGNLAYSATNAARTLSLGGTNADDNTFSLAIPNNTAAVNLIKNGTGRWILTASSGYAGVTTINSGTLEVAILANGGSNSSIGASTNAATNLVFGASTATLRYAGSSNVSTNRSFTMSSGTGGGATIESSGTGTLSFDNTIAIAYGTNNQTRTLTLGGTNAGANTFGKVIANNGTGATSLVKNGTGNWVLNQTNTYTGATNVSVGTLEVSGTGSINNSSGVSITGGEFRYGSSTGLTRNVTVSSGGTFRYNSTTAYSGTLTNSGGARAGSGNLGTTVLGGTGSIDPGNSPGILTASATDPSAGLDYNFEFTAVNTLPTWNNASASGNDVLRLTDATNPFAGNLDLDNMVNIYLNVASLAEGQTYTGGFYTDKNTSFLSFIAGADINYYLLNASSGLVTYNGIKYDLYTGPLDFTVSTLSQTANFGAGDVNGYVSQFTVIPEPNVAALIGGLGMLVLLRRRR